MKTELSVARKFVAAALAAGHTVSVCDGEEWTVKRSAKLTQIMRALHSTDSDVLRVRNSAGEHVGTALLVWGNSPEELIADYTDNEATRALVAQAELS